MKKDETNMELEFDETTEDQNVKDEGKKMRKKRKIFTKRNMVKAAKYAGAFTLGFIARTGFDMLLGGKGTTQASIPETTTVADGVTTTTF